LEQAEHDAPGRPQRASAQPSDLISLGAIFRSLLRHAWILVLTTGIGLGLAYHYAYNVATPMYTASASIILQTRERPFISFDATTGTLASDVASLNTEIGVLRGPDLIGRVVDRLDLDLDPEFNPLLAQPANPGASRAEQQQREALGRDLALRILLGKLQVRNLPNSLIFQIEVTTTNPRKSVEIANTVAETYITEQVERKVSETERASDWLQTRVTELQAELQEAESRVENFRFTEAGASIRLEELTSEAEAIRTLYRYLLTRLQETTAQEGLQRADSRMLSSALTPLGPSEPRHTLLMAVGGAVGLFLGLVLVFLKESLNRSIRSRAQLETVTGLSAISELPKVGRFKRRSPIKGLIGPRAVGYNGVLDNLITTEILSRKPGTSSVMAVVSAKPGDGKTTFTISMAHRVAARGIRTLLIDADTHKRQVTRELGGEGPGLLAVLAGEKALEDAVQYHEGLGADVLICETRPGHRGQYLSPENVQYLIAAARETYSVVILDTPPILAVHDALVFGKVADRIMLMVRCNSTSINDVEASMKMMQVVGLEPTSLVLNHVRTSAATQQQYSDYLVSS
jgi:uncharacterized protein involved in exopolysaccharide biosynthesis/cellulose biosynthesis protein BcsQ